MMKALTICQPYAHLIVLPDDDDRAKRVENRNWSTSYRGQLLIHAGKSRAWLKENNQTGRDMDYDLSLDEMTFGAIVGICKLSDCVGVSPGPNGSLFHHDDAVRRRWPWLHIHQHVEGPHCFVLTECRAFDKPIPYRGAQGFFNVPDEVVAEQLKAVSYA